MEALKPLLLETGCILTIYDTVEIIGDRYYIKATAVLVNSSGEKVLNTAFAREEENKKGMDASQLTGATSSYARKYCLNGLFLIDDTKDADTDAYTSQTSVDKTTTKKPTASNPVAKRPSVPSPKKPTPKPRVNN